MHKTRSTSRKAAEWSDSTMTTSEHLKIEPAIMASEIERLPDLAGFLKLASSGLDARQTRTCELSE